MRDCGGYAPAAMIDLSLDPALAQTRGLSDRLGDHVLRALAYLAALIGLAVLIGITLEVLRQAHGAFSIYGFSFIWEHGWDVNHKLYSARDFIYGTLVTGLGALLLGTPLAVAIALYLNELAPKRLRTTITALVELLAAIPSVVLGLFGIIVLGPFVKDTLYPILSGPLGFIPFFGKVANPNGSNIMTAIVILTIMVVPIIASVSLEVLRTVPPDLKEGALALGSTRWEMIRGVMLPSAKPGIIAAVILGFGRAAGEAIAVTQVIGGASSTHFPSWFNTGDTLASRIASEFQSAAGVESSALLYLGAILLVISLVVNILAQLAIRQRAGGRPRRRIRFSFGMEDSE
jgi:phosphate transport system permease protein